VYRRAAYLLTVRPGFADHFPVEMLVAVSAFLHHSNTPILQYSNTPIPHLLTTPPSPSTRLLQHSFTLPSSPDIRILQYSGIHPANPLDTVAGAVGNSALSSTNLVATTNTTDAARRISERNCEVRSCFNINYIESDYNALVGIAVYQKLATNIEKAVDAMHRPAVIQYKRMRCRDSNRTRLIVTQRGHL
jgi:hypothetical protein